MKWIHSTLACAVLAFSFLPSAHADVTWDFNFTDTAGVGFNANGQTGADRRAGLQRAASYISSVLGPSYTATIRMDVNGSLTGNQTLASAGSNFSSPAPANGFGWRGDVMTKILGGADPNPNAADGTVTWNFQGFNWAPGDTFQPGEMDLISTATHELTHALGFSSIISQTGNNEFTGATPGTASAWTPFDQFVAGTNGTSVINGSGVLNGTAWNAASVGGTGPAGLQFNGPNARAAAGGPVYLYSPTTWSDGSSGSHLDTDWYNGTNGRPFNMMNHNSSVAEGLDIRAYNAIEFGILRDIGYLNVVPAPSGLAVALIGVVPGATILLRRRKR